MEVAKRNDVGRATLMRNGATSVDPGGHEETVDRCVLLPLSVAHPVQRLPECRGALEVDSRVRASRDHPDHLDPASFIRGEIVSAGKARGIRRCSGHGDHLPKMARIAARPFAVGRGSALSEASRSS